MLGVDDSSYNGGEYVMQMIMPEDYPFAPPSIVFLTPSGRFEVGKKICTTFSDYHPESWSPGNSLTTLMFSMVSFMTDELPGVGGIVYDPKRPHLFY